MNIKNIISVVVFLLTTHISFAQFKIMGNIKDGNKKENLVGASVYLNDLKKGASTDESGNYRIFNF